MSRWFCDFQTHDRGLCYFFEHKRRNPWRKCAIRLQNWYWGTPAEPTRHVRTQRWAGWIRGDRQEVRGLFCHQEHLWGDSHALVPQRNPNICKVRLHLPLLVAPELLSYPNERRGRFGDLGVEEKSKNVTFCLQFLVSQKEDKYFMTPFCLK